jgi:hypothetical protein
MPNFRKLAGTTEDQLWLAKESTGSTWSGVYLENIDGDPVGAGVGVFEPAGPTLVPLQIGAPTLAAHACTKTYTDALVGSADASKWISIPLVATSQNSTVSSTATVPAASIITGCRIQVGAVPWTPGQEMTIAVVAGATDPVAIVADSNTGVSDLFIIDQMNLVLGVVHTVDVTCGASTDVGGQTATVYISYVETPAP